MNETKKLLLVDPQALSRFHTPTPASNSLTDLDEAMQKILGLKNIDDSQKWALYNEQLQKYFFKLEEARKPLALPITESVDSSTSKSSESPPPPKFDLRARIQSEIPPTYRKKATALYDFLADSERITWDRFGTVSIDNLPLEGSNLIDLLGDLQRSRKNFEPKGLKPFLKLLRLLNVARELVGNTKRWDAMQEGSGFGKGFLTERERTVPAESPVVRTGMQPFKWERLKW